MKTPSPVYGTDNMINKCLGEYFQNSAVSIRDSAQIKSIIKMVYYLIQKICIEYSVCALHFQGSCKHQMNIYTLNEYAYSYIYAL